MKKAHKEIGYVLFLQSRGRRTLKRRKQIKSRERNQSRYLTGKTKSERKEIVKFKGYTYIKPPNNFSFIENTQAAVKFTNELEDLHNRRKKVFVNLEDMENVDYGAVAVLLSIMHIFRADRIGFNGSFPSNLEVKEKLVASQFFKRLYEPLVNNGSYVEKEKDQMLRFEKNVAPEMGLKVMEEASVTIWNSKRRCKGLQRTLLELMQNTHNHAARGGQGKESWWLSIHHDLPGKRVSFVFVDYGQGIFESLRNKPDGTKWSGFVEKVSQYFNYGSDADVFKLLLDGKLHLTITGQDFRGKGLPGIRQAVTRNQISNLHIVTNTVFANPQTDTFNSLGISFNGTLVFWDLCYSNKNEPWIT